MIENSHKTSLLIPSQLPEFIRDNPDYSKFVAFIQAYYEWLEQTNNITDRSKNLLNYRDIDKTTNEFLQYFINDFLPYFPQDALADQKKLIKIARELYKTKGTPASYQFLFRVLYDSDFDLFYTKDAVLKASAGTWYVAKSLKLASTDNNWLNVANYRIFGETTKTIATIENTVKTGSKVEVFISNIERLFQSGEFVYVVDNNNQPVLFNGNKLRAKIVGQISQVNIDPNNRGTFYSVGDPVIVYGGLNSETGLGAIAEVGSTTAGSIRSIGVITGGFGYRADPQSLINISGAPGAIANIASLNPDAAGIANVSLIPINEIVTAIGTTIGNTRYSFFSNNITANANTTLANAFSFTGFTTYPISSVIINNGGGGITVAPSITAVSTYDTNIVGVKGDLRTLGVLAPVQIANGGVGYVANDRIIISGGIGYGAYANVTNVSATGAITSVAYVTGSSPYPLGGMGYRSTGLPTLNVQSANTQAHGASLYVPGILGDGAAFSAVTDRAGSITTINLVDPGEDYISAPNVSLKITDILISNVNASVPPRRGDTLFQGANINVATYIATVNSISLLTADADPTKDLYNIRVFNYTSTPNPKLPLRITDKVDMLMANTAYPANAFYPGSPQYNENGTKFYGDGAAKGTASFLNGLVIGQGQYLTSAGQPSSYDVLQSSIYNNFTYQITVEKEIAKYRYTLLNLLHPAGMNVLGRYALKSSNNITLSASEALDQGHSLYYYTQRVDASVTMSTDFTTKSTNILQFNTLGNGVNLASFIFSNSSIALTPPNGPNVHVQVASVNTISNTVTATTNTWLTFANVANAIANTGGNTINILSLTGAYDIINNAMYSNTAYPLYDIVYAGDQVLVANNTAKTVESVDYVNGIITISGTFSANANSYMSVKRTFSAGGTINDQYDVIIYGPTGTQYFPEIVTESGIPITTEDDRILLLG